MQEKGNSFTLLGASFIQTGTGQNNKDEPLALGGGGGVGGGGGDGGEGSSVTMCQRCSRCVVARLARPFSRHCVFRVLFCLFYLKR